MAKKVKGPDAPMVAPKKQPLRLINPLHPPLVAFLRYLEGHPGGTAMKSLDTIAQEMGTYPRGLSRWLKWLELYGAVHIDRHTGSSFGVGCNPYRYHLLMPVAEYEKNALAIREVVRAQLRPPKKSKAKPFPKLPLIEPDEMALIREQARAEVEASIRAFRPLPELREDPLDHIEAEAWRMAFNAE